MGEEGGGRSCGTTRELQKLKQQAMEYYRENDVPRRLEELLNSTFYLQPADVYGHLANCFSKLAKPPTICKIVGKDVLDGLGLPTLQVDIFCTIQNFPKNICSVVISTHFEVHENVLPELAEAEEAERASAVSTAVQWVNSTITHELQGMAPSDQAEVDHLLRIFFASKVQEDKERKELENSLEYSAVPTLLPPVPPPPPPPPPTKKRGQKPGRKDTITEKPIAPAEPVEPVLSGSMAIGAVSLAVAKACAMLLNKPLYLNIALLKHNQEQPMLFMPLLMVSLVSCGKSSSGKLNLMKEVICIPHPELTTRQGVEMLMEIQKRINKIIELPSPPKAETKKGHDGSKRGQSKGKYEVIMGTYKNAAEMVDLYVDLINKYPSIIALIDPFRKEDSEQWDSIYHTLGSRCYIIAGTASKSISKLLEQGNISIPKSNGLIIKHTNQTTMSDLVEITNLIDSKKHITVFGSTEGESSDDSLVDLAVGLGVRFIKLGGLSRGERVTKYNRLLTIEEELVQNGTLGFNEERTFFYFNEEAEKAAEALEAAAAREPLAPTFPTQGVEESAEIGASSG
ncbi:PREDICTED: enolase 4 isoform X4 [Rhinopithecus bieti]|uniref:enolase 4 isoform X4 n=1 Tax=Rhinopithecus bieti TaxID=61621 RepID=UPI00083C3E2B|nr:PREDICTED: enolase 4 isoform X4 [Rhinopithecus bieti]